VIGQVWLAGWPLRAFLFTLRSSDFACLPVCSYYMTRQDDNVAGTTWVVFKDLPDEPQTPHSPSHLAPRNSCTRSQAPSQPRIKYESWAMIVHRFKFCIAMVYPPVSGGAEHLSVQSVHDSTAWALGFPCEGLPRSRPTTLCSELVMYY
jgi:hypothetical protein